MRRSSKVGSARRSRPIKASADISRCWRCGAEMDLVLADEFRDGNVPAQMKPLPGTRRAFQALPPAVQEYYFRGDSACWEKELVKWLRDEARSDGRQGPITFGITLSMTSKLKKHIVRWVRNSWNAY